MRKGSARAFVAFCCLIWAGPAIAQKTDRSEAVCTLDDPVIRASIERLFTDSVSRGIAHLEGVDPTSLAAIEREELCDGLQNDVSKVYRVKGTDPEYEAHYFQADNRYLVFITWIDRNKPDSVPPGMVYINEGMSVLRVYDQDMVLLVTVSL